jgi:hypothetical protein
MYGSMAWFYHTGQSVREVSAGRDTISSLFLLLLEEVV